MSGFEADLRAALIAAPTFGWREQRLRARLDGPDTPRKVLWLARCQDVAKSHMIVGGYGPAELAKWFRDHWLQVLQAFLSLAALLLPLLLGAEDEAVLHGDLNEQLSDAMETGWKPGSLIEEKIYEWVAGRITTYVRKKWPGMPGTDAELAAFFLEQIKESQG